MFVTGQKVVCVDDKNTHWALMHEIVEGQVYTVRWVGIWNCKPGRYGKGKKLCIRVAEVVRYGPDIPFYAQRFRPLVEKKTDISIFKSLLRTNKQKIPEKSPT